MRLPSQCNLVEVQHLAASNPICRRCVAQAVTIYHISKKLFDIVTVELSIKNMNSVLNQAII